MSLSDSDVDMDGETLIDQAGDFQPKSPLALRQKDRAASSAANLPITATLNDALPWVEKYRPQSLAAIQGHSSILSTIRSFIAKNQLPHLLFYGPPGTGKTSTILALARGIYGGEGNMRQMVLELNASDERGIDVVREQIRTFASTRKIFGGLTKAGNGDAGGRNEKLATYKLIILDEADSMTSTAQMALRRIMEKYTANTRFCIIANYTHKLSPALLSRTTRFRFSPLPQSDILQKVTEVIQTEHVKITSDAVEALVRLSKGDMRRALNVLQACHAGSLPLEASLGPNAAKMPEEDRARLREVVGVDKVYDCVASPHPEDVQLILRTLLEKTDVTGILRTLEQIKTAKGLALADIVTSLAEEMGTLEGVSDVTRISWLEGLSEIEYRVSGGASETIQLGGMVGVVRGGCELAGR